jgi:hypothetical protein
MAKLTERDPWSARDSYLTTHFDPIWIPKGDIAMVGPPGFPPHPRNPERCQTKEIIQRSHLHKLKS